MGMFDTFRFSKQLKMFPEGLPHDDWQTKDLDSSMDNFWVDRDGRVARKAWGNPGYFYNESIHFTARVYQSVGKEWVNLRVVVEFGYLKSLQIVSDEADAPDEVDGWNIPATGPGPDDD